MTPDVTGAARVECIAAGEIIRVADALRHYEPFMVMRHCGKTAFPAYFCEAHDVPLANLGNLMLHLEDVPDELHRVVIWCQVHRRYETVADEQQRGFQQAGISR